MLSCFIKLHIYFYVCFILLLFSTAYQGSLLEPSRRVHTTPNYTTSSAALQSTVTLRPSSALRNDAIGCYEANGVVGSAAVT